MTIRRLVWVALAVGAIYFTVQAGEFSSRDILKQRGRRAKLQAQVDSLQRQVDSLQRVERAVRTDPVVQERIAREEFGMVRGDKEIVYKFVTPEAAGDSTRR
jgi:cell division protein FtsB